MNIAQQIIQTLQNGHKVELSGMGVLSRVVRHAEFDDVTGTILPPKQEIIFDTNRSIRVDNAFSESARQWMGDLITKGEVSVEGLGKWTNDAGKIIFFPDEKALDTNFYGLEAIPMAKVQQVKPIEVDQDATQPKADYKFNRSILWVFLIAIPVAGLIYLAITQKEMLFGKKSFDNVSVQTSTHRIVEDTLKIKQAAALKAKTDSIRKDSLKQDSIKKYAPWGTESERWKKKRKR